MVNVSAAFKAALEDDNRNFSGSCTIILSSGETVPIDDSKLWDNGFVVDDSTSGTGSFDIGSAIVQKFTLRLNNIYDDFTNYDFTDAKVSDVRISLNLSGKQESVSKGMYTVNDTSYDGDIITLECLDNMHKFDVGYSKSKLTYPATLLQIVQDACSCCGVVLANDSLQFEYYDYVIQVKPTDDAITFRDVLTWVGQISGHFWKCNTSGQLSAGWYNISDLSAGKNVHTLQTNVVTDVSVDLDDVVITCVRIVTEDENSNQVTFQSGSDGYAVVIDSNGFITNDNAAEIATMVGGRIVGLRFRPMTVSSLQDPTIEAGDGAIVYDRKSKSYKTFFTNVVFSIDADNQMSNEAESALRNSAEKFSEAAKIYQQLKKQLSKNKSEWKKAMEELEGAMQEQKGLYPVIATLDDGSKVYYLCDHPTLEESEVVFELNSNGWAVSTDGGETWNAGLLVDGTMIAKILNAIGINADWINTGSLKVVDADGKETIYINADTGEVRISPTSFSLSGKSVSDIADDTIKKFIDTVYKEDLEKLQNQIDGKVEEYYYSYKPTLDNLPASEWKTDADKKAHEGDRFFDKGTGHAYRFFKNDETGEYEWTLIQDADVIEALNKASKAQETADGKRRVFIATPTPPYDPGDLWVQGSAGDIMVCKTVRQKGDVYKSDDWQKSNKYTDDTKANEALEAIEKLKTLSVVLNNEYQTVSTDADGNYKNFPEVATTVSVYMGSVDVTDKASYTVTKSSGITGTWNLSTKTYTVTGLSTDSGYVDITASYSGLKGARRFTVAKLKAGAAGPAGTGVEVDVTSIEYQIGNSGTVKPTGSWSVDIPNVPAGKYLWTRTSVTYSDGTTTETYTVSYKSTDGKDGKDGVSPTVSISKSGNTTTITIKDEKGTHTQTVKDGTDGTPGTPGANGKTPYFHVKYSNDGGKTFTSNSGETVGSYIGTCTDYNSADPTTVGAYTWAKIRGEDGDSVSIESQQITYQASNSGVTIPTGTWNTSVPSLNSGQYLWTRTMVNYSDGTTTTSYSVSYKGGDGDDGGTWTIEVSSNTIKRGEDGVLKPSSITAKAWYQVGKTVSRTAYSGRLYVYTSMNGSTWTQASKSDNASSLTYGVSKLASTIYWIKFTLCATGTDTVIDQQTVQILDDVSSLTGEIMLNKLSGGWQGIYSDAGKYYIDAEYIRGNAMSAKYLDAKNLTVINKNKVETLKIDADGNVSIYATSLSIAGAAAASQDYVNTATAKQLESAKAYANTKSGNLLNGTDLTTDDRKTYWNITGTITEGRADPDGGKNAILLTGTASDNFVSAKYSNNNPIRTAGQYEVRVWLRTDLDANEMNWDTCISFNRVTHAVRVGSEWKQYKFSIPITTPSTSGSENFTIGGWANIGKGDKMYIYKPEVIYSYTPEDILNMLTNNGAMDGLFIENNQIYMRGTYIKVDDLSALKATIGGWKINTSSLSSASGNISLLKSGQIQIGDAKISASGKAAVIKYGLSIYTDRQTFTDGTGEFRLYGMSTNSGRVLTVSGNIVGMQASSSKRYKKHIRNMTKEEAEKILSLPVVWFQYKDGYLLEGDSLCGKDVPGFYAEDVARLFPECAAYDEEGRPEDWNYRMLLPVIMKVIQGQNEKISTLEDTVNTLNERLNELDEMLKGVVK